MYHLYEALITYIFFLRKKKKMFKETKLIKPPSVLFDR